MKKTLFLVLVVLCVSLLYAQWPANPEQNLKLTNSSFEEVIPKVAYGPDGHVWVSWFSAENGNYNVRVQRFSFNGEPAFPQEGILVSNHTQMSWLTDWDMKVDSQNNAILAFLDVRTGNQDIYVYKISPDGAFLWGNDGIAVSNDATEDYTPALGVTDQNNVIVTWMTETDTKLQKIMADGTLALAQPMLFHEEGFSHTWPQIMPQDNDSFILKYAKDSGPFYAVTRHVFAQKYDSNLNPVWATPTTITNQGGISSWTQIFSTATDGDGGFVICWYEDRDADQMRNVYVQHVLNDGSVAFAANGVQPTVNTSTQHFYPIVAFDQFTGDTWMVWSETDANQNARGLRAQKLDSTGNSVLGENGLEIISLGSQSPMPMKAHVVNSELVAVFTGALNGSAVDTEIKAFKLNTNGQHVWPGEFVSIKTAASNVVHMKATDFMYNQMVFAWEDSRTDPASVYLQNLNFNGSIGIVINPTAIQGTVTLNGGTGVVSNVQITIGDLIINPDAQGQYYTELAPGTYTLTATLSGYQTLTVENVIIASEMTTTLDLTLEAETAINENEVSVKTLNLRNYPNPFNPSTQISFNLNQGSHVELLVFNNKGQKVNVLKNQYLNKGTYQIEWNGKDAKGNTCPSGIYFYRLKTDSAEMTKKMLMIK